MSARVVDITGRLPLPCDCARCIVERLRGQLEQALVEHDGQLLVSAADVDETLRDALAALEQLLTPRRQEKP